MKNNRLLKWIIGIVVAALLMFGAYKAFTPKTQEGSKSVTVEVVNKEGETKSYETKTDAEYLKEVMEELKEDTDFAYEGEDSDYGLYITSINGEEAVYDNDGAYWAIYVNGEYGSYGADQQPVADGDTFRFAYEVFE